MILVMPGKAQERSSGARDREIGHATGRERPSMASPEPGKVEGNLAPESLKVAYILAGWESPAGLASFRVSACPTAGDQISGTWR